MISADLRRVRKRARKIARPRLQHLLHWMTWHALQDLAGRTLYDTATIARAEDAVRAALAELADRGAFRYFGIASAFELGPVPIELRRVTEDGGVALEVEPITDAILDGGRRGGGWLRADELSIGDLAR